MYLNNPFGKDPGIDEILPEIPRALGVWHWGSAIGVANLVPLFERGMCQLQRHHNTQPLWESLL